MSDFPSKSSDDFVCPRGHGALRVFSSVRDAQYRAKQPGVSGTKIENLVRLMQQDLWSWPGMEIHKIGNVIVDGHHRYLASILAGIEPIILDEEHTHEIRMTFAFADLFVDTRDWYGR